ncbi:PIN domain-containing protein [Luteolibacter arcticus]|uniref:PIN domain-containing protein n=1 Tax=Luteolibacter arcticus TaxID=1581411 RepID=A0ABT3GL03_9BACT|nr:PIN domain-containing protein [Luteolibacter arcticus]MCW1924205.1 PIN domain-containing protein [Luteolibacter arcticus]
MKAYADTGFLVSVHSRDANTSRALARMTTQTFPLAWSWMHELEFRNAMRLRVFRGEVLESEVALVFEKVQRRLEEGVYGKANPPVERIVDEFERLSASFSTKLGTRSLDVLHVSLALVLGVKEFLTFDSRQIALAKAAGLKVPKL